MVTLSVDKTTLLAIAIPMAALLLVGYISYENTVYFIQKDVFADRVNLMNQRLEHLVSTITDAETGQRGFIITNNPAYLEPYNSALTDIHSQLGNLDIMIANEPSNQQHNSIKELNILNGLIEGKLAELNQTIMLRQSHGLNAALPIILSNRGKVLMDKIRTITSDIQSQENNTLSDADRQSEAYAHIITNTIMITTIIAAATTGVSIFAINRGIHKRHLAIQRSLQTQVKQRTEELQNTNNQLLAVNEQLKLHDKMQNEFINIASHEMKTPTQAILGYSKLIQRHPEKREEMMRAISRNATRLQRLTSDILDVTRIESQSLKLNIDIFNISEVVSDVVEDYRSEIKQSKSDIELLYNPYFDNRKNPLFIEGDVGRITQIISNLVSNAIKFTNKGGQIFVTEEEKMIDGRSQVVVSIKDNGQGIDPELMPKLFSKFVAKSEKGIGLGLFISKNIVEAHGGRIWAKNNDSDNGGGATFTFSLPLSRPWKAQQETPANYE